VTFSDKTMTCRDCGQEFIFSVGEQEFYQLRGLQNEPRRCPDCRNARRTSGPDSRSSRELHEVVCSNCGQMAQVPFVPNGSRPVYCSDCFRTARTGVGANSRY